MAPVMLTEAQLAALDSILDDGDDALFRSFVEENGLHACYATDMGRLMLAAEKEAGFPHLPKASRPDDRLFQICKQKEDMRCQVGQVLSNLRKRCKRRRFGSRLCNAAYAFQRNAEATVQIVDKRGLQIEPDKKGKIQLLGIESRNALNLSIFARNNAHRGLPLCDEYFYANELIPKMGILGSGFFIDHDKVVTATHVLMEAFKRGVSPENLMFIRGHHVRNTQAKTIKVWPNQLYKLDQQELIISEQMRDSDERGDMAWVRATPYFEGKTYPFLWNGLAPKLENPKTAIYALGHGLGVPMKLAFGGEVQDLTYHGAPAKFTCDVNILPGSSGAPIFDANTHRLLGIVSGLHEIYTSPVPKGDCVNLVINLSGKFSGVATHIAPFSSL